MKKNMIIKTRVKSKNEKKMITGMKTKMKKNEKKMFLHISMLWLKESYNFRTTFLGGLKWDFIFWFSRTWGGCWF